MPMFYDTRKFGEFNFGPFQHEPDPADGMVRLYHGTTREAAERIRAHGFQPADFDAIVGEVARRFGVDEALLNERLTNYGSFHAVRTGYSDGNVYFADSPHHAEQWARWGGEARIEALGAAIALQRGTEDNVDFEDPEIVDILSHTPWVVAVDIPYVVPKSNGRALSETPMADRLPTGRINLLGSIVYCSVPADSRDVKVISAHQVERAWKLDAIERALKLRWGSLDRMVEAGRFPRPDYQFLARRFWWQSTLDAHDPEVGRVVEESCPRSNTRD